MSTFTNHETVADRSASDRRRHKEKIEDAIKEGIHNIVAEESIIGQDGKKKIKIPVKGIKEYRFVYGDNQTNPRPGSAPGHDLKRGQGIGQAPNSKKKSENPNEPGSDPGEEFYEVEITLEELSAYLFNDLELPDMEKKSIKHVVAEKNKRKGYRKKGIRPRLDKKETIKNKIKRRKATEKLGKVDDESFSFHENDLKYRHISKKLKESSNACIFFVMDISGSMTSEKKFLARSFFFLLYHFINSKYENTEVVFISHDTNAYEVDEEKFFSRGSSGGTMVSSAIKMVNEVVSKRFHPELWNIYCFQCSDGDNWPNDKQSIQSEIEKLVPRVQLFGYCEIEPDKERRNWFGQDASLSSTYEKYTFGNTENKFKMVHISEKFDIWPAFEDLLGKG